METKTKISAQNLNLYYGENHALKNINLDLYEHKITAFIGPSGCGKSTFLKTLNRMNDLVTGVKIDGTVLLDEEDIYDPQVDTTLLRKKIGMVFQQPNPFPMSIYDNVAYGPRIHGIRHKAQLDEIVERSLRGAALWDEVSDRLKKSALGLSGGQQQRLCIARALAVEPGAGPPKGRLPGPRGHAHPDDLPGDAPGRQVRDHHGHRAGHRARHRRGHGHQPGIRQLGQFAAAL